jgi:metal-responsive CopG/Arc/MetJ family transcriptional regulator
MSEESSRAFATRLPSEDARQLESIIEATGQSRSDVVRRAIRFYLDRNPDRVPELYPEGSVDRMMAEMGENGG